MSIDRLIEDQNDCSNNSVALVTVHATLLPNCHSLPSAVNKNASLSVCVFVCLFVCCTIGQKNILHLIHPCK